MRDIKRFVNQKFLYTVNLELLWRFLARYERMLGGRLADLTASDPGVRDRLFYYFLSADEMADYFDSPRSGALAGQQQER